MGTLPIAGKRGRTARCVPCFMERYQKMAKSKPRHDDRPRKRSTWGVFRVDYAEVRARNLAVKGYPLPLDPSNDTAAAKERLPR